MVRSQMAPQPGKNVHHVVIHAASVGLAVVAQMISSIFLTLTKESYVPNGWLGILLIVMCPERMLTSIDDNQDDESFLSVYRKDVLASLIAACFIGNISTFGRTLFKTSSWNVSETFSLGVTMDQWSGGFWIMIDLWSLGWLLHAVISLFKRNVLGPELCNPEIHPPVFYLLWVVVNIARMSSMLLWHRRVLLAAVPLWWMLPVLSFYMLSISYRNLHKHKAWLAINTPRVTTWTHYLTQNGLAVFAWWSLVNALVGFGVVLKYRAGVQDSLISAIILAIICMSALTWFLLQIFWLRKYLRYTFCVYAILVLSLSAMFTRSYRVHKFSSNTSFCGCVMLITTCMNVVQLICECWFKSISVQPLAEEPYEMSSVCETVCQSDVDTNLSSADIGDAS